MDLRFELPSTNNPAPRPLAIPLRTKRKLALSSSDRAWRDLLQSFEAARDEWSAMEAVVKLELLLEAEGLLIEKETAYASRSDQRSAPRCLDRGWRVTTLVPAS